MSIFGPSENSITSKIHKYTENELAKDLENQEYKFGFVTDIESDTVPIGLNEDIIRLISTKKNEPDWLIMIPISSPCFPYSISKIGKPTNEILGIPAVRINTALVCL